MHPQGNSTVTATGFLKRFGDTLFQDYISGGDAAIRAAQVVATLDPKEARAFVTSGIASMRREEAIYGLGFLAWLSLGLSIPLFILTLGPRAGLVPGPAISLACTIYLANQRRRLYQPPLGLILECDDVLAVTCAVTCLGSRLGNSYVGGMHRDYLAPMINDKPRWESLGTWKAIRSCLAHWLDKSPEKIAGLKGSDKRAIFHLLLLIAWPPFGIRISNCCTEEEEVRLLKIALRASPVAFGLGRQATLKKALAKGYYRNKVTCWEIK